MKSRAAAPLARANRLPAAARAHARWPCNPPTPPPSLKPCRPASAPPRGRPWPPTRPAAPPPPRATPPTAPPALKPFDPAPAHTTAAPLYHRGTHRRRTPATAPPTPPMPAALDPRNKPPRRRCRRGNRAEYPATPPPMPPRPPTRLDRPFGTSTVDLWLRRLGLSYKKNAARRRAAPPRRGRTKGALAPTNR